MIEQYSIWLVPCKEDEAHLSEVIQDLAEEYDAPQFRPHCTLYSPVTDIFGAESILESMELNPIAVTKTRISHSDSLWKSIFIELEKSPELSTLQQQVKSQLFHPNPNSFKPHISLIYKKMPEEEKESIIRKLNLKETYLMDKIELVKTGDKVENWKSIMMQKKC